MHFSKVMIILATVGISFVTALPTPGSASIHARAIDENIYERAEIGKIGERGQAETDAGEVQTDADAAYGLYEKRAETDADAAYGVYEK